MDDLLGDGDDPLPPRRQELTWPVVASAAIAVVCLLGSGSLLLMCVGRWPA